MVENVGYDWFEKLIPNDMKYREDTTEYNFLMKMDFIQLNTILFCEYPFKNNQKDFATELNKILKENKNNIDGQKIKNVIENYEYKSNYERYFGYPNNSIEKDISELYKYRCVVAIIRK